MAAMSFQRKILILGILIVVLAGTYILGLIFSPARVSKREARSPLLPPLKRELVQEIRLSGESDSLQLLKQGGSWVLPAGERVLPASQSRVEALFGFLKELKRARVVTGNPESWQDFEVGSDARRRIRLLDESGKTMLEIVVGKTELGGSGSFVRLEGSNEVLLSDRSFDYYLNTQGKFWSYLRIFPEDLEGQDFMRLTVKSDIRFREEEHVLLDYTLLLSEEKQNLWLLAGQPEARLDSAAVDRLADALADLEGTEFASVTPAVAGLDRPAGQILVSTMDNRDFRLLVGAPAGDDQFYIALQDGELIYKVSEWRLKGILKRLDDLREKQE